MQITGHCRADAWEPWTDPLDPGTKRVKKLVILKEVVCDGSKMKLNDMVSEIGQYKTVLVSTQLDPIPLNINTQININSLIINNLFRGNLKY